LLFALFFSASIQPAISKKSGLPFFSILFRLAFEELIKSELKVTQM